MSASEIFYKGGSDYWKAYREGRPNVPDSYFKRILEYHSRKNGQFNALHDMGAGNGIHTERLSPNFKKTIISDPGEANIEAAKSFLSHVPGSSSYEYHAAKAEDLELAPSTVDLVFGANMMHYTDVEKTLQTVVSQLKPGGTLALGGFGIAVILDAELQNLWTLLCQHHFETVLASNPKATALFVQACSPHDAVPFDTQNFKPGALRLKFNMRNGWSWRRFVVSPKLEESIPNVKAFGDEDEIVFENDEGWDFDADVTVMRKILQTFPLKSDAVLEDLRHQFETAFGDRTVRATWPAALTLVTKK